MTELLKFNDSVDISSLAPGTKFWVPNPNDDSVGYTLVISKSGPSPLWPEMSYHEASQLAFLDDLGLAPELEPPSEATLASLTGKTHLSKNELIKIPDYIEAGRTKPGHRIWVPTRDDETLGVTCFTIFGGPTAIWPAMTWQQAQNRNFLEGLGLVKPLQPPGPGALSSLKGVPVPRIGATSSFQNAKVDLSKNEFRPKSKPKPKPKPAPKPKPKEELEPKELTIPSDLSVRDLEYQLTLELQPIFDAMQSLGLPPDWLFLRKRIAGIAESLLSENSNTRWQGSRMIKKLLWSKREIPVMWWRTALGRATALTLGLEGSETVSMNDAGEMLGVGKARVAQLAKAGILERGAYNRGYTRASVMRRVVNPGQQGAAGHRKKI